MSFKYSGLLFLLLFAPLILGLGHFFLVRKEKIIAAFFSKENFEKIGVKKSRGKVFLKYLILSVVFSCFVAALAAPRYGFKEIVLNKINNNIFIAVDTSLSMRAKDVKPSRIEVAKRKIIDFIDEAKGERIALVPFAGESFMLIPLTTDYSIFESFKDVIDCDIIPVQGTNFYKLIEKIVKIINKNNLGNVSLVVLSDGEDFGGNVDEALKLCGDRGITVYSVGIGGNSPAPIPLKNGGFKKDKNGNLVTTKLNESFLEKIALKTGGVYVRGTLTSKDIAYIYKKISKKNSSSEKSAIKKKIYFNRFQWFVLPAFLLFCFYLVIDERRRNYRQ